MQPSIVPIMKKPFFISLIVLLFILIGFGVYLFLPLASTKYTIAWDQEKLNYKKAFLAEKAPQDSARKPNILVIMVDDLGKYDCSLYEKGPVATPNIQAIAKNGVLFTEGYVTAPICSPSRAGMLTGRYQQRFGHELQPNERYPKNRFEYFFYKYFFKKDKYVLAEQWAVPSPADIHKQGLPPSEITLAELLKKQGYQTGVIGKWHLGNGEMHRPLKKGFDYQYGFYEAFSLFADSSDKNIFNQRTYEFADNHVWQAKRVGPYAIYRNDRKIEEKEYLTDRIAQEATQFISQNKEKPFFLYLPFSSPHTPFQVTRTYYEKFAHIKDPYKRIYYAMIQNLDDAIGRIMDHLKKNGLEENTIVFFISDNGGATYTKATTNAPLKGGKFTHFEGGINVPFALQWKGKIQAGSRYEWPVISTDIFATVAQVAGCELPSDRTYDGVNLIPFVRQENRQAPHPLLFWRSGFSKAVRKGNWKLLIDERDQLTCLYDLGKDKFERKNLAGAFPEKVRELKKDLENWEKELIPPLWPGIMYFHFPVAEGPYHFAL